MKLNRDSAPRSTFESYKELTKPRIVSMVLVTASIGYFLGGHGIESWWVFAATLLGTAMTAAGSGVLNHYLERDVDKRMDRTRNRPLPSGVISPNAALLFGIYLVLAGVLLLLAAVNLLTAFLALLTAFLYTLVYTPMKRLTWWNTLVGAVPGALPPMGGWTAATGHVDAGAWALFLILFVWQIPHFYAIAWMFRDDYRKGGFKMLPVIEPDGKSTFRQIVVFCILLIPVSLLPTALHLTGAAYAVGAVPLGLLFLYTGLVLGRKAGFSDARRVLRMSIVYLPALLGLIVADVVFL